MRRNAVLIGACMATLLGGFMSATPAAAARIAPNATVDVIGMSGTDCTMDYTNIRPSEDRSSVALQRYLSADKGRSDTCVVEVEIRCAAPQGTVLVDSEFMGSITLAESTEARIDVVTAFNGLPTPVVSASFRGPANHFIESQHRSPAPSSVDCTRPIRAKVTSTQSVTGSGEGQLGTRLHTINVT